MSQTEQPLISHLVELRTRLLRSFSAILLAFVALIYFSNDIYDFVARPLLSQLPAGTSNAGDAVGRQPGLRCQQLTGSGKLAAILCSMGV